VEIPASVIRICRRLNDAGFEAFVVGGAVRDFFLYRNPKDWDVATSARPEEVTELFDKVVPTGIKFGTVTVHDDIEIEVTTYRCDGKYSDGRRPEDVMFTKDIHADLARRDLAINAMALDPLNNNEIVDPFNGQNDLKERIIRAVGDPMERFSEDGLRPMRAVRFASQLNFEVTKETFRAIRWSFGVFSKVSMERIRDELCKILVSNYPEVGINLLVETGLMRHIIPSFLATRGVVQNRHHTQDVYNHSITTMSAIYPEPVLRLTALLHDIGKPDTASPSSREGEFHFRDHAKVGALYVEGITKRLKFSTNEVKKITHLVKHHLRLSTPPNSLAGLRRLIKELGVDNIREFLALRAADIVDAKNHTVLIAEWMDTLSRIDQIGDAGDPLEIRDLEVNGSDIIEHLDVEPGPIVGKILNILMEAVLEDPSLNTREALLEIVDAEK